SRTVNGGEDRLEWDENCQNAVKKCHKGVKSRETRVLSGLGVLIEKLIASWICVAVLKNDSGFLAGGAPWGLDASFGWLVRHAHSRCLIRLGRTMAMMRAEQGIRHCRKSISGMSVTCASRGAIGRERSMCRRT